MNGTHSISLLCDITRMLNSHYSFDQILSDVAMLCVEVLHLEEFSIYIQGDNQSSMVQSVFMSHSKPNNESENINSISSQGAIVEQSLDSEVSKSSQLYVPITWNGKIYGMIDAQASSKTKIIKDVDLLLQIIASLLVPKLIEIQRPKREFGANNKYYKQLIDLLEQEKLYKDEKLCLKSIAEQLNLSTSYLSQIINKISRRSFSTLVNEYRVKEVKEALQKGKHRQYSLLSIAFDAGFSSKSTFNAVFKNVLGCSPSQYIREFV